MVDNVEENETLSVGSLLKDAREKKNVSVTEVASQLHLDSRIIGSIEEDAYDLLPDPIYVRGYIRSYCKLLGENADKLIEIYQQNATKDDPEIIPEIKYPAQTSSSDKPVKAFTYLMSLGLVLLLIAWWQSNFIIDNSSDGSVPIEEVIDTPVELEEIRVEELDAATPSATNIPENISIAPIDLDANPETVMNADSSTFATGLSDTEDMEGSQNRNITLREDPYLSDSLYDSTENSIAEFFEDGTDDSETSNTYVAVGPDTLVLNLTADSWIEIFDVYEQKVYFDLGRTGDRLTLHGSSPFDILLGFAQGVTIEFNGRAVDQSPYTRAGVARFTLGE